MKQNLFVKTWFLRKLNLNIYQIHVYDANLYLNFIPLKTKS